MVRPKMPSLQVVSSISGNCCSKPDKRSASCAVAPPPSSIAASCCTSLRAYTTSTCRICGFVIQGSGAACKCRNERIADFMEHRACHQVEHRTGKLELHVERDLGTFSVKVLEAPMTLKMPERTVVQGNHNAASGTQLVAGDERFVKAAAGQLQTGAHLRVRLGKNGCLATPRQEFGVTRNVVHQCVHLRSGVRHQRGLVDDTHALRSAGNRGQRGL